VPMHVEHDYRHPQQLCHLPQRVRQYCGGAHQRVPCLRVQGQNVLVDDKYFSNLPYQLQVVGKLSFADAAGVAQQPLTLEKAVDGDHIVGPVWKEGCGGDFEIDECMVGAQE